ncbi:2TM domain-containing protein [uncultured Croceitalea sp.]|uniref:2TM domain-containing protein n=1 Tax=uncultured Croceitalea sp. TaxID=1798908 RepID=UPI00374E8B57
MSKDSVIKDQLAKAKKRVETLKNFYKHLTVYVVVNGFLLLVAKRVTFIFLSKEALGNPGFLEWIDWNVYGTPIIWGLALLLHAAYVFISSPFKKWEERQIQSYIRKDREETEKFTRK